MKNIFKDNLFMSVVAFGIFIYIAGKLLPDRNDLMPFLLYCNIVLFSLLTLVLALITITSPRYSVIKLYLFMPVLLNSVFFWAQNALFGNFNEIPNNMQNVYAGIIQVSIGVVCFLYIALRKKY